MKLTWLFATVFGLAVTLSAGKPQPTLSTSCLDGQNSLGDCKGTTSNVLVTGSNFPKHVLVIVTDGTVEADNSVYGGPNLDFTESLYDGTWTINVYSMNGNKLLATTTVTVDNLTP